MEEEIFLSDDEKNKANNSKDLSSDSAPQSLNKDLAQCEIKEKKRKWWIAGLLTILVPGLGQVYNGEPKKGFIFFFVQIFFWASPLPLVVRYPSIWSVGFYYLIRLIVGIYIILEAVITSKKTGNNYLLKTYNKTYVYTIYFVISNFVILSSIIIMRTYIVQDVEIPFKSMEPTLLMGEYVFIDKLNIPSKHLKKGDIILFRFKHSRLSEKSFIKRVVGVGNDVIEIRNKKLYVNNIFVREDYIIHKDRRIFPRKNTSRDNCGPIKIPVDCYFVLGDNRDSSFDSRFFGFVKQVEVKGIVKCIYWSYDRNNNCVRWQKIGKKI